MIALFIRYIKIIATSLTARSFRDILILEQALQMATVCVCVCVCVCMSVYVCFEREKGDRASERERERERERDVAKESVIHCLYIFILLYFVFC